MLGQLLGYRIYPCSFDNDQFMGIVLLLTRLLRGIILVVFLFLIIIQTEGFQVLLRLWLG